MDRFEKEQQSAEVQEEISEYEEFGDMQSKRRISPVVWIVAAAVVLILALFAVLSLANSDPDSPEDTTVVSGETQGGQNAPSGSESAQTTAAATEQTETEPAETTTEAVETEDPTAGFPFMDKSFFSQFDTDTIKVTLNYHKEEDRPGRWEIETEPAELAQYLTCDWDQLPHENMENFQFGRIYFRVTNKAQTQTDDLLNLWIGFRTKGAEISFKSELDIVADGVFGSWKSTELPWKLRKIGSEEWTSTSRDLYDRRVYLGRLLGKNDEIELMMTCTRTNTGGQTLVIEVLGMTLADLNSGKRTPVN